jgi:formylglycine-generating enzyme required for sulfatase activity
MRLSCDRTGFPLLAVPDIGVEVQLLPVTKVQLERFLAVPNSFGDSWYEEVLACNPRVSYRQFSADTRERLFVTGVFPEEALAFARWLGEGFDLPTSQEWRALFAILAREQVLQHHVTSFVRQHCAASVGSILERLLAQLRVDSLLGLSLMCGGLVEWVRQDNTWIGLGAPRPGFHPNLWDPLTVEVKPLHPGSRMPYFGFRLVRRGG